MRSEVRFVMSPDDEIELVRLITSEAGTVLVDGPRWGTPEPPIVSRLEDAGQHLLMWSPADQPSLATKRHERDGAVWWYCRHEMATIQFLRCRCRPVDPFLYEGRLAVATTQRGEATEPGSWASSVEHRFLTLKRRLQKTYTNKVIIWQNRSLPRSKTNPLKPDNSLWVGPHALRWLEEEPEGRWVLVVPDALATGYLLDLVPLRVARHSPTASCGQTDSACLRLDRLYTGTIGPKRGTSQVDPGRAERTVRYCPGGAELLGNPSSIPTHRM